MKKTTFMILRSYDDPIRSAKLPTSVYKIMTWFGPKPDITTKYGIGHDHLMRTTA